MDISQDKLHQNLASQPHANVSGEEMESIISRFLNATQLLTSPILSALL